MTLWCKPELQEMAFTVLGGDWCSGELAIRLLGARAESAPRSLLTRSPQHQGFFWPDHAPIVKVQNFITGLWFGPKTPWCWSDLAKRLLAYLWISRFLRQVEVTFSAFVLISNTHSFHFLQYFESHCRYFESTLRFDSLVPGLNQHQGVFWPDHHPNTKESFV